MVGGMRGSDGGGVGGLVGLAGGCWRRGGGPCSGVQVEWKVGWLVGGREPGGGEAVVPMLRLREGSFCRLQGVGGV